MALYFANCVATIYRYPYETSVRYKVCFTMKWHQKQIKAVSGIFFLHIQLTKTLVHLSFCFRFFAKAVYSIIYINLWISSFEYTLYHSELFQNFVPRLLKFQLWYWSESLPFISLVWYMFDLALGSADLQKDL